MNLEIRYFDQAAPDVLLGREVLDNVEEALLPYPSTQDSPVFMSKKFNGRVEYRWKVISVEVEVVDQPGPLSIFTIVLATKDQLEKEACLLNIVKKRGKALKAVVPRGSLVEVEYGHQLAVGKANGDIRTNKRYPETLQRGSMPKRRLAIVIDIKSGGKGVIQVVPITSKERIGDKSAVDVTLWIDNLVDYQKRSWAVCSMVESVSPTRIFAPLVSYPGGPSRDTGFGSRLGKTEMARIDSALVHGVGLHDFFDKKEEKHKALSAKVAELEAKLAAANEACQLMAEEVTLRQEYVTHVETLVGDLTDTWVTFLEAAKSKLHATL